MTKVLIVEDETRLAHWVQAFFEKDGFETVLAHDGQSGLRLALTEMPDLVVLDIMLPKMDGMTICTRLRRESDVPIIMVTAKDKEAERIKGLNIGADDYVTKPFSPAELVARAKALLRRTRGQARQLLTADDLELDISAQICSLNGETVSLTPTQFKILETLMRHPNQVLSREQILEKAFTDGLDLLDRTIDAHIRRIRKQIEADPKNPVFIQSVYGSGYKFIG